MDTQIAEHAILGLLITNPTETAAPVFAYVTPTDFTGSNTLLAEAIHGLRVKRTPIDPTTVLAELTRRSTLSRVGGGAAIYRLIQEVTSVATLDHHLADMVAAKRLRALEAAGTAVTARAGTGSDDPAAIARFMVDQGQAVLDAALDDGDVTTPNLDEFLSGDDPEYDWVIPGLLERSDRLVLTGSEGLGKSTLFRQLAVCTAAGIHPFTGRSITPQRVLYVDCENGAVHLRRKLRPLAIQARAQGQGAGTNLYIEGRPEGLNLTAPSDQQWLLRRVAALQPAVLFTGSLYKLFEADPNKEEPARTVAATLDRCRAAANCSVVIEAHAGHASDSAGVRHVRPVGASLWLRWPEFGYGLRATRDFDPATRVVDFVAWRGDRDERRWPKRLKAGSTWPFVEATYDAYNDTGQVA